MMLNLDVYRDLAEEIVVLANEDPELTSRFLLSGQESVDILRSFAKAIDTIRFHHSANHNTKNHPKYSFKVVQFLWDDIDVYMDLRDPHTGYVIRRALSSVKKIGIASYNPLSEDIMDLLLENPNITELEVHEYDLLTAKPLIESRRFKYIKIGPFMTGHLNDVRINTDKLEFLGFALEKILQAESIRTNSLVITHFREDFNDIPIDMNSWIRISRKMSLNRDLYHKVIEEIIISIDEGFNRDVEPITKFMFSGKEPLNIVKHVVSKDNSLRIETAIRDHCVEPFIRWTLSSVRRVTTDLNEFISKVVIDLLLKNPNFKELTLRQCHVLTANLLLRSRKFDHIKILYFPILKLYNVRISTKELEFSDFSGNPLENIFKVELIRTPSLTIDFRSWECNDSLFDMDVSPSFKSLKKLNLRHSGGYDSEKILKLLEFLNAKLLKLKLITFRFEDIGSSAVEYGNCTEEFYWNPAKVKDHVMHKKFDTYNGRIKFKVSEHFKFVMCSNPDVCENYCKELQEQLQDCEYSSCVKIKDLFRGEQLNRSIMFRFGALLNHDLYYDLAEEFIVLGDRNPGRIVKFMLSGKDLLEATKKFTNKIDIIRFQDWWEYRNNSRLRPSPYAMRLIWDSGVEIGTDLQDPFMKSIIRWSLSSVRKVQIYFNEPLPEEAVEPLLNNPNFRRLELYRYDPLMAEFLLKFKKFDYVFIEGSHLLESGNFHVETEELEFRTVSLVEILKSKSIKTKSLITTYGLLRFTDIFNKISIKPEFKSLEMLKLNITYGSGFDGQKFLNFLEFLNMELPNLKLAVFNFEECPPFLIYDRNQRGFSISPSSIKGFIDYKHHLSTYKGKARIELHHHVKFDIDKSPKQVIENYIQSLKEEFANFEYSSLIERKKISHLFGKTSNVTKNFELKNQISLNYDKGKS
ncbi:hypothetical protein FO519_004594 [Halicephalobus sp. NKZ332]|nr:hypothetical protein FO519_004594 [Halicephalobus sp. NKZ332]